MASPGGRKQRPHTPHRDGPRVYRVAGSRYWKVDLRPWGMKRRVIRDPSAPGWPETGERTELKAVAEEWKWDYLRLVREEHRRRVFGLGRVPQRLGAAVEGFVRHREQTVERSTSQSDRTGTGHLLRHYGSNTRTHQLTAETLQELADELLREGYEPSTLETYRKVWRIFLEWCHFGVCGRALRSNRSTRARLASYHDPVASVVLPDPGKGDVVTLTDEQIPALLRAAAVVDSQQRGNFPSARLACGIGLFMGARQGEIFALPWQAIRPETRSVRIEYQVPKDSTTLKPLKGKNARTALVLPGWWDLHTRDSVGLVCGRVGRPVGTRTQRNLITRVLDTAGLNGTGIGWHMLRHTYARCFLEHGGRLGELQKSLGHRSVVTTEARYEHFHEDVAAKLAAERIYGA